MSRFQILRIVKTYKRKGSENDQRHFNPSPPKKSRSDENIDKVRSMRKHQESQSGQCSGRWSVAMPVSQVYLEFCDWICVSLHALHFSYTAS